MSKPWTPTTEEVLDGLGYTWIDWHRLVASEEELEAAFWRWFDEEKGRRG